MAIATYMLSDTLTYAARNKNPVRSIQAGDDVQLLIAPYDYSIVSFYKPSQPDSVEFDEYIELAKDVFDLRIREKDLEKRKVGWFRVDVDANPQQGYSQDSKPDQMVIAKDSGLYRFLHLSKTQEKESKQVDDIAQAVLELTGEWVVEIECDKIQFFEREAFDEVVYFGAVENLKQGGSAASLNEAAMMDKYQYDEGRYNFFYNSDPECRETRGLDKDKEYIVFYNGENSIPKFLELGKDKVDADTLMI